MTAESEQTARLFSAGQLSINRQARLLKCVSSWLKRQQTLSVLVDELKSIHSQLGLIGP